MNNPYEHDWLDDEVRVERASLRLAVAGIVLFLLAPAGSLLFPSMRPEPAAARPSGLEERLAAWETGAKTLPLFESWREGDQAFVTRLFRAGNAKVFVGQDGWLHYRPDLEAVFGKGPYHMEPPSVARERHDHEWQAPVPVIEDFAASLAERGIRLVFVPVPTKAMVCREGLGGAPMAVWPAVFAPVKRDLSSAGIEIVDLMPLFAAFDGDASRFLRQDTHWTPEAMAAAAREVAGRIGGGSDAPPYSVETMERESAGDLVGMLDLREKAGSLFPPEKATLRRVLDPATGRPITSDPASEVVLLGDSFVNVFEDPALGFAKGGEASIGAGFPSHFGLALGKPAQVIAINGGGASAAREAFATLPPARIAGVKTVVWVLSARDLLLSEIPARRAGVEWRRVSFQADGSEVSESGAGIVELVASLRETSPIEDPALTPYGDAVFSTLFEEDGGGERNVFFWAFRGRKLEPAARLEPGRRYRLRLVPLERNTEASRAARIDDLFRPDLTPWFAESFETAD